MLIPIEKHINNTRQDNEKAKEYCNAIGQEEWLSKLLLPPIWQGQRNRASLAEFAHFNGHISHTNGEGPFVVIPAQNTDCAPGHDDGLIGGKNAAF